MGDKRGNNKKISLVKNIEINLYQNIKCNMKYFCNKMSMRRHNDDVSLFLLYN